MGDTTDLPVISDSRDAPWWFARALDLAAQGDRTAALSACEQAIAAWPDIAAAHRLQFELARDLGDRDRMIAALRMLVRHDPGDARSCAILGGLLCDAGDFAAVVEVLRPVAAQLGTQYGPQSGAQSGTQSGDQGNVAWNFSSALAITGANAELRALRPLLDRLAPDAASLYPPYEHLAMARLAGLFDRGQVLSDIVALQNSPRWLDAARTLAALGQAIDDAAPFSLLRIDIAVARFIALGGRNAHRLLRPQERLAALDGVWTGWFGGSSRSLDDIVMSELDRGVLAAIADADIIAMPDAADLHREHRHFGFLAETRQLVQAHGAARYAGTHVALQMHHAAPYLRTLLSDLPFLGLIGATPELLRKLALFLGIAETAHLAMPASGAAAADILPSGHLRVLDSIAVPFPGAVVLISAPGPLGLIYADRVRQRGGIAIDLGPLAGTWAG